MLGKVAKCRGKIKQGPRQCKEMGYKIKWVEINLKKEENIIGYVTN